jgi:S1-C subfamily serine protease
MKRHFFSHSSVSSRFFFGMVAMGVLLGWVGCSAFPFRTTATIWVNSPADSVAIGIDDWNAYSGFYFRNLGEGRVSTPLDHYAPYYLLEASRPGHFTQVLPVFPHRRNWLKPLDLGGMGAGIGLATEAEALGTPSLRGLGIGIALVEGLGWLLPNRRLYADEYRIPDLTAYPQKPDSIVGYRFNTFTFEVPSHLFQAHHYENITDFNRRSNGWEELSPEGWEETGPDFDAFSSEELNEVLYSIGMQTGEGPLFHNDQVVTLSGKLNSITEFRVAEGIRCYSLETQWWRTNPFDFPTDTVLVRNMGTWGPAGDPFEPDYDLLLKTVARAMVQATVHPKILKNPEKIAEMDARWRAEWDTIYLPEIKPPSNGQFHVDQLESVVTVVAPDGHGSGCILSEDGLILTNYHVVSDTSDTLRVRLHNGEKLNAEVVRYHPAFDLALIRIASSGLKPFHIRSPNDADLGEPIYSIGTPFHIELPSTLNRGILSGFRSDGVRKLLQTDVSISPGNSGGALVHASGSLMGIVTEKITFPGVEGLGFAVDIEGLQRALQVQFRPKE